MVCSMIGLPAILISCLGMLKPDPGAGAAGQHHGDVAQAVHRVTVAARSATKRLRLVLAGPQPAGLREPPVLLPGDVLGPGLGSSAQ